MALAESDPAFYQDRDECDGAEAQLRAVVPVLGGPLREIRRDAAQDDLFSAAHAVEHPGGGLEEAR